MTKRASSLKVVSSWPRTLVRAVMAAWRTSTSGASPPTSKVDFHVRGLLLAAIEDDLAILIEHLQREVVEPFAQAPSVRL